MIKVNDRNILYIYIKYYTNSNLTLLVSSQIDFNQKKKKKDYWRQRKLGNNVEKIFPKA